MTTQKEVALQEGIRGLLPCKAERDILIVQWRRGLSYFTATTLVILDMSTEPAAKSGSGYMEGSFNIDKDYSLIFSDVRVIDEGRYYCVVFDLATGKLFYNYTDVTVLGKCFNTCIGAHDKIFFITLDTRLLFPDSVG